jgi:type I restriction enzyme S subunit
MSAGELEIGDGYRAKNDELATSGTGLIFLRAGHVTDSHIDFGGVERFVTANDAGFGAKVSQVGDVIVTTKGNSTGRVAFVSKAMPRFVYSPHLSYWRATSTSSVRQDFLRAWSRSGEFARQVHALSRSTDMAPYLSLRDQRRLEITIPPEHVQALIGQMADALNDRIDLLRQTNATLEAIAQVLFKSWFVDFDPVRAKAEGREPEGMDSVTAALFPSEFEESELGLIPKGWAVDEIGKVATCVGGATPSTKEPRFWDDPVHHWVTPKDLSGLQSPVLTDTDRKVSQAGLAKISSGLLPVGTVLLSSRAPIGYLAIAHIPTAINQGFIAMLPGGKLPPSYLLFWTKLSMDAIKQKANGSTFMEISKSAFRPMELVVAPPQVVSEFDSIGKPLLDRIAENEKTRRQLAEIRDTLLPRLISGKLRLPEAEKSIEDAVA